MKTSWNSAPVAAKTNAANTTAESENQTNYDKTFEGIQQLLGRTGSQGIPDEYKKYVNVDDTGVAAPGTSIGDFSGTTDKRQRQGPGSIVDEGFSMGYNPQTPEEIAAGRRDLDEKIAANSQTAQSQAGDMQKMADSMQRQYAQGGLMAAHGRYLQGGTDGMADKIPSSIDGDQPAALSHGEFVIPADVVSHLGNGNSDAGAEKLYQMMARIRKARTGNSDQGKKINPDKFMPGGLAKAYAEGGAVKHFQTGGTTSVGGAVNAGVTGLESNLSNWAGPYVTDMLAKGMALSEMPYQAYTGPLTAGQSGLQEKVSTGLQGLNFPGNLGQSFSSAGTPTAGANGLPSGGNGIASNYMNPYLQNVLQPQLAELRRQNDITNMNTNAKLTGAGGYGGGRQAIMNAENDRNLLTAQNTAIGQGYANAYDKAMQQFNTEQGQSKTLVDMMAGQGATDRGITAEGIAADKAQFEEARENPYKMVQYQQSLLQGMPLSAQAYNTTGESALVAAAKGASTVAELLKNLGIKVGA